MRTGWVSCPFNCIDPAMATANAKIRQSITNPESLSAHRILQNSKGSLLYRAHFFCRYQSSGHTKNRGQST